MTKSSRPDPFFIADHPALDFLNSVAAPSGTEFEWLDSGLDLINWLQHADLVPNNVLTRFKNETDNSKLDTVAAQARELREWFRAIIKTNAGKTIQSVEISSVDPINALLASDNSFHQLTPSDKSNFNNTQASTQFAMKLSRQWNSPDSLLIPLAEILADLICQTDFTYIKNCEGPSCTLWFHDISKNHGRRWCSMAVCGNRAKAAAHRAKKLSVCN